MSTTLRLLSLRAPIEYTFIIIIIDRCSVKDGNPLSSKQVRIAKERIDIFILTIYILNKERIYIVVRKNMQE